MKIKQRRNETKKNSNYANEGSHGSFDSIRRQFHEREGRGSKSGWNGACVVHRDVFAAVLTRLSCCYLSVIRSECLWATGRIIRPRHFKPFSTARRAANPSAKKQRGRKHRKKLRGARRRRRRTKIVTRIPNARPTLPRTRHKQREFVPHIKIKDK